MDNDLTIAFSGHNIKWFAVLAMESFLLFYPNMREKIIYFDDNSTDGTKEELEKRNIKVITWLPQLSEKFKKLVGDGKQSLPVRVSFIYRCIFEQIKTKYVFISDGDVVFKKGGFLEEYFKKINEGFNIITPEGINDIDEAAKEIIYENKDDFAVYLKYIEKINNEEKGEKLILKRVVFLHTLMDLEYFKKIGIIGDAIENIPIPTKSWFIDTGANFRCRALENNVHISSIDSDELNEIIYHWTWLSSANRDGIPEHNRGRNYEEEMEKVLYDKGLEEISRKVGIHPMKLIQSFKKTRWKSDIIGMD